MKEKMFCKYCGKKMIYYPIRSGRIRYIDWEGDTIIWRKEYSIKTGKELGVYECPDFKPVISKSFFWNSFRMSEHSVIKEE